MTKYRPVGYALSVALIVFVVFQEVRTQEFLLWDDDINVYENPVLNPPRWALISDVWSDFYFTVYTPLANTVLMLVAKFAYMPEVITTVKAGKTHLDSGTFHTANLICHTINSVIVFCFFRTLLRSDKAAFVGTLLFAIHPLQVEAVAWITGWHTVFGGTFALLALWLYCVSIDARLPVEESDSNKSAFDSHSVRFGIVSREWFLFLVGTIFYVMALLSKPIFMTVPLVAFALDWGLTQRTFKQRFAMLFPWLILTGFFWYINQIGQGDNKELNFQGLITPLWQRPFILGDALSFYLKQLFLPLALGPDYGRKPAWVMAQPLTYVIWVVPAALIFVANARRRRNPAFATAVAIFFLAALPTSGLVPYYFHAYSTVADRYLYLGLLGPAMLVGYWATRFNSRFYMPVASVLLLALGARSVFQIYTYHNTISYFENAKNVNPQSWMAYMNLSTAYSTSGDTTKAFNNLIRSIEIEPKNGRPYYNMGVVMQNMGRQKEAIECYEKSLNLDPSFAPAYNSYAYLLSDQGRQEEAMRAAQTAVRMSPSDPKYILTLANIQLKVGQARQAAAKYEQVLKIYPEMEEPRLNLALANHIVKRGQERLNKLMREVQTQPNNPRIRQQLAMGLLEANDKKGAIENLQAVTRLEPKNAVPHYQLAMIYKQDNDMANAQRELEKTLQLDPNGPNALLDLGVMYSQQKRLDEAQRLLERAVNANPEFVLARYNLGGIYLQKKQKSKAIEQWKKVIDLNPSFMPARQALASQNVFLQIEPEIPSKIGQNN